MRPEQIAEAVEEFKAIFKKEFGIELSNEEATEKATTLLQLFDCLTQDKNV